MICEFIGLLMEKFFIDLRRVFRLLWFLCSWNYFKYLLYFNEYIFFLIRYCVNIVLI